MSAGALAADRGAPLPRGALALATLGLAAYVWLGSLPIAAPIISPDEFGYLSDARALAGRGDVLSAPGIGSYPWGYPLLLAPLAAVFRDPLALYRATLALNAGLLAALVPGVFAILRRLELPAAAALVGGLLVASHPSLVTFSHLAFSENLFVPLVALAAFALVEMVDRGTTAAAIAFGAALSAAPFVRSIGGAATAAGLLVLVALLRRPETRRAALLALGAAVVGCLLLAGVQRQIPGFQAYGDLHAADRLRGALADPLSLLRCLAGQVVSISLSTWLLFPVVVAGGVRRTPAVLRAARPRGADVLVVFAAAAALATLAISTVFVRPLPRLDHAVYARYNEGLLPLIACAGAYLLRTVPRGLVGWPAVALLALIGTGAWTIDGRGLVVVSVCPLYHLVAVEGLRNLPFIAALVGGALALLWRGLLAGRRAAVAAALLLHVAAGVEILLRYHVPGARDHALQAEFLQRLGPVARGITRVAVLGPDPDAWGRGLVSFLFPDASRRDGAPGTPPPELVLASKHGWAEARPGYRLVSLQQGAGLAAWLREDAGADRLPAITLPPDQVSDYRADFDLATPPEVRWGQIALRASVVNRGADVFPDLGTFVGGPWPLAPVRLGLRFEDAAGRNLGQERLNLPRLAPGERCHVSGRWPLPSGASAVVVDLIQEGRRWFGQPRRFQLDGSAP